MDQGFRLRQTASRKGEGRWVWSVRLDAPDPVLDRVAWVEYFLHPSFKDPVRRVDNRRTGFRLDTSGWGEFELRYKVHMRDGDEVSSRHWVQLTEAEADDPTAEVRLRPSVFISHSTTDHKFARELGRALKAEGIEVQSFDDLPVRGVPVQITLDQALRKATAVVLVIADTPGTWDWIVTERARESGQTIIPVLRGEHGLVPHNLADLRAIPGQPPRAAAEVAREVAAVVGVGDAGQAPPDVGPPDEPD